MDQSLIDAVVKMTGLEPDAVQERLSSLPLDDVMRIFDFVRNQDTSEVKSIMAESTDRSASNHDVIVQIKSFSDHDGLLAWLDDRSIGYKLHPSDVIQIKNPSAAAEIRVKQQLDDMSAAAPNSIQILKDHMAKQPTKGSLPKPRDPMAKALALPQYQPKSTPTKKGILAKQESKHKGKFDEADEFDLGLSEIIEEGVMGMTTMPNMLPRLLTLAGLPSEEDELATDDVVMTATNDFDSTPVDDVIDTDPIINDYSSNMALIRNAFKDINSNLSDVKVSEFAEVRNLLSDLMSSMDRMANTITNK